MASKHESSLRERVHYKVDNYLAKGSSALFLSLLIAFLIAFVIIALLRMFLYWIQPEINIDPETKEQVATGIGPQLYRAFLELTAPGNMNQDVNKPHLYKIAAILAGFTGVIIFSTLIATLTTALNQAIRTLKRGHSRVLEAGHTLILGWTHRVPEILKELVMANETDDDSVVVILSEEDKEWMDEYLRTHFRDRGNLRVVTRSGMPASPENLSHVCVAEAKSVIVLSSCAENAGEEQQLRSDARAIKIMLALESAAPGATFPIVIELFLPRNREVVRGVAPNRAFMVDAEEILAKVMVQTSRTSGLSVVYSELLSFDGCEMYFYESKWGGIKFGDCQFHFPDGVPIGIRKPNGEVIIRPPLETVMADDFEVLIVAEDDSTIEFRKSPVASATELPFEHRRMEPKVEKMLMIGWSQKANVIISEYSDYVLDGSGVTVVVNEPEQIVRAQIEAAIHEHDTLDINFLEVDPFDGNHLKDLDPFSYNDIMILPQAAGPDKDAEQIDSETIVVLLLLRKLKSDLVAAGQKISTKIVTEVLDSDNHALIHQAGVNDFVISNRLVSMIFAQISEEPDIQMVYDDLFQEDGSEIYVKPVELYFGSLPVEVSFADLMLLAQKRDEEVCIGYKIAALANNVEKNYGVELIPPKHEKIQLSRGDALVVVAEDER